MMLNSRNLPFKLALCILLELVVFGGRKQGRAGSRAARAEVESSAETRAISNEASLPRLGIRAPVEERPLRAKLSLAHATVADKHLAMGRPISGSGIHAIQFVAPDGSDTNDGTSTDRPKKTIYAALESLKGGEKEPPTAGHGIVLVSDGAEFGGDVEGNGIWLMGQGDSQFKSPPHGWLRYSGGVRIVCLGNANSAPDQHIPQCQISAGGNRDDRHPAVWLSSIAGGFYLEGLGFNYPRVGMKLGIDSSGDRLRGGVQNVELKSVSVNLGDCRAGDGPGIDIGNNTFWIWLIDSFVSGCGRSSYSVLPSPNGLKRTRDTVLVSTEAKVDISVGQVVSIYNPENTLFAGSCLVVAVPDVHHFECSQHGPDGVSGSGWIITGKSAAVNIDPAGGSGAGLLFFRDNVFNVMGPSDGIRFQNGLNGGSIDVQSQTCEGGFRDPSGPCVHIYWDPRTSPVVSANIWHAESADNNNGGNLTAPAIQVDGPFDPSTIVVSNAYAGGLSNVSGPMTVLGQYVPNLNGLLKSPLREGQIGFFHNRVVGETDAARRQFGPTAVRYENLANVSSSKWLFNIQDRAALKLEQEAPDGTRGAATASESNGPQNEIVFYRANQRVSPGDYFIAGVWTRARSGYFGGLANFSLQITGPGVRTVGFTQPAPYVGDGEWEWLFSIQKIDCQETVSAAVSMGSSFGPNKPITAYGPVLLHIPGGSISDNEAYELAFNLASFDSGCAVGSVCGLPAENLQIQGTVKGEFLLSGGSQGLESKNVNLSPNWGTLADVSSTKGSSQRFSITVNARGTGVASEPKLTVTFPKPWPVPPVFICKQVGGTGPRNILDGENDATEKSMTLTYHGIPTAGLSYTFTCVGE
jgi:hypothetical protein